MEPAPNGKHFHERIIKHTKAGDLDNLIGIVEELSQLPHVVDWMVGVAKMGINISANLIGGDLKVEEPRLRGLHSSVETLVRLYPALVELESVEYSFAKIKLAVGLLASALELALGSKEPRLRIFTSILEYCGRVGNHATSLALLESIASKSLVPTEVDFAHVIKSMRTMEKCQFRSALPGVLHGISDVIDGALTQAELVQALESTLALQGVIVHSDLEIPNSSSVCPVTGTQLEVIPLSAQELDEMLDLTKRLIVESGSSDAPHTLEMLEEVFSKAGHPHIFLDGANIAHTNQNFEGGYFRFDQMADIARNFGEKNCLIVLHSKWTNPRKDLRLCPPELSGQKRKKKRPALPRLGSEVEVACVSTQKEFSEGIPPEDVSELAVLPPMDLIESWRRDGLLVEVPHGQNDDWFWMHACCLAIKNRSPEVPFLVSNDQMRDHFWRMHTPKFFRKFVKNHVCKYAIRFDGEAPEPVNMYEFSPPPPHSIAIHQHGTLFHVPVMQAAWLVFNLADLDSKSE